MTGSGTTWTIDPSITLAAGVSYAVRIDSRTFHNSDGAVFFGINDNTTLNFQTNAPPVLTLTGSGTQTYTEQGTAALPLAGSLHVNATDANDTTLAGATITLGSSFAGDALSISGTLPTGITIDAVHSTATTLVLTGVANLASYEAAFEQVAFSSTSDNPTNFGASTSRTVSFTVTDGAATSNTVSTTLNVAAVNDAPVNHVPAVQPSVARTSRAQSPASPCPIRTPIRSTTPATPPATRTSSWRCRPRNGTLTVGSVADGSVVGSGSSTVTLTGTQNSINAALAAACIIRAI